MEETTVVGTAVAIPHGVRPPIYLEARMAKKIPAALAKYQFKKGSTKAKKAGKMSPKKGK
jgi:mannitol/fructose-specific phosphotransferase system IIA component